MFLKVFTVFVLSLCVNGFKLKQVIVLSRHNIRTPLVTNLHEYTEKKWPKWPVPAGHLTEKGGLLERYMGKYFAEWLTSVNLLQSDCPNDDVFIYSNTRQRTKETAKAFSEGAFGGCVPVHFKNTTEMDPVFNPAVRNISESFRELVFSEMQKKIDKISVPEAYKEVERILDFGNSSFCHNNNVCELSKVRHNIYYVLNKEPDIIGPLSISNLVIDAFMMAYYDGKDLEDVAWGHITTPEQWELLMTVFKAYHDLRFKTTVLSRDLASTLLEYMTDIFLNGDKKFYLLVGHDSNINSLMAAMNFKDYELRNQHEKTPIGGKLVFQKWHDEVHDEDLLRVDYVYQSSDQIRDGSVLSLENPPHWALMEMENCEIDENGFCLWDDFVKVLKSL